MTDDTKALITIYGVFATAMVALVSFVIYIWVAQEVSFGGLIIKPRQPTQEMKCPRKP